MSSFLVVVWIAGSRGGSGRGVGSGGGSDREGSGGGGRTDWIVLAKMSTGLRSCSSGAQSGGGSRTNGP